MAVANDKTPFWTYPRTSLDDGICYHIRDQRKSKHADIEILEEHPLAKSDPAFENMVFVHREPADREGILVRDWYVPKSLVDDLLSVSKTGAGARSTLLYPVGTEPPEGDPRIDLLGHCRGEMTFNVLAVDYPTLSYEPAGTTQPAHLISLTRSAGVSQFTEDEVYIDLTELHADTVIKKYVDGVVTDEFTTGVHKIVRHVSSGVIHVEVPAQATSGGNSLGGNGWKGRAYTAKYILEGTTDSEDAPGILKGKFLVRNFNYRLGDASVSTQRDETLGVKIVTERRAVPSTWSYDWLTGYPSSSNATCTASESYSPVSELVTQQTKQFTSGSPDSSVQETVWYGYETVSVPKIITGGDFLWAWAFAGKNGYAAYDDDVGLEITSGGGGGVKMPSKYQRFILADEANIEDLIDGTNVEGLTAPPGFGGHLYNPGSTTYTVAFLSWSAFAGKNVWAKARVRTWSLTGSLILGTSNIIVNQTSGGAGDDLVSDKEEPASLVLSPKMAESSKWNNNTWTPYNVRVQRARWCYWILDFVWVKYPAASTFYP